MNVIKKAKAIIANTARICGKPPEANAEARSLKKLLKAIEYYVQIYLK